MIDAPVPSEPVRSGYVPNMSRFTAPVSGIYEVRFNNRNGPSRGYTYRLSQGETIEASPGTGIGDVRRISDNDAPEAFTTSAADQELLAQYRREYDELIRDRLQQMTRTQHEERLTFERPYPELTRQNLDAVLNGTVREGVLRRDTNSVRQLFGSRTLREQDFMYHGHMKLYIMRTNSVWTEIGFMK